MKSTFAHGASTNRNQRAQQSSEMRARANELGFTLIELVIAIALVGILTAVAIVGLTGVTATGNTSACKSAVGSAQTAAATYYANTGNYPTTFDVLVPPATPPLLTLPSVVTATSTKMYQGSSATPTWSVTMQGGGSNTPNIYTKTGASPPNNAPCT
jgi:prepilin-type N-terminal cleavage/methylation domain-containing protein